MHLPLLLAAIGAPAADGNIACIVEQVPREMRSTLIPDVFEDSPRGERVFAAFQSFAETCGRDRSWSPRQVMRYGEGAILFVMRQESEANLQRIGIAPAFVDRWFESLPEAEQRVAGLLESSVDRLHRQLIAAGTPRTLIDRHPPELNAYLTMLVLQAQFRLSQEE